MRVGEYPSGTFRFKNLCGSFWQGETLRFADYTVNVARLKAAKSVKFRIFHGDADNVVTPEGSRAAYRTLKKAGADVEYIEFPGCNHGSWNPAFNYPDFMSWLFSQKK